MTGGFVDGPCFGGPYVIVNGTNTPPPTPTPSYSGAIPPHIPGKFILKTLSDWNNYVASSYFPGASPTPPFNPPSQILAVDDSSTAFTNPGDAIIQVCDDGTAIHVVVEPSGHCPGGADRINTCDGVSVNAVMVPNNGEPVVWDVINVVCPPGLVSFNRIQHRIRGIPLAPMI
jgi:hypothetical protein